MGFPANGNMLRGAVIAALMAACIAAPASAASLLTTHVPDAVLQHLSPVVGRPDPTSHLQIEVSLPMRNRAALDALLRAIYDPASPQYRHYLSVAEFADRFGPTAADYEKATAFFKSSGLAVGAPAANRYIIELDGAVSDIERVFHVTLALYKHPTEKRNFIAPDREPTLDLDVPILHVTGLDDFTQASSRLVHPGAMPAVAHNRTGSAPGGWYLGSDMRAAYYGGTALTGKGQSVGLMLLASYRIQDIALYFTTVHQPLTVQVNGITTDGSLPAQCDKCEDSEQSTDIDSAISMAPGLDQVQAYVSKHALSVLNRMASDDTAKQLSTSWGWEHNPATDDPIFREMAAQGQTFLTASGDKSGLKASGAWPEEDANVTGVGGTDLVTNGAGGSWKSETGWQGSGGGPSLDKSILIAGYQLPFVTAANKASRTLRNVPDIAANAASDFYICANSVCDGDWGGTSFASPMWAGYIALVNEQAARNGKPPVGFLNPTLYALVNGAAYHTLFHDIVRGRSGNHRAVAGYDLVTGLGSANGDALVQALAGGG